MPVMSGENILTCNVKDLYVNCEYYFRVKAINKVGAGEYLELRNPVLTEEIKRKAYFWLLKIKHDYLVRSPNPVNKSMKPGGLS